MREPRNRRRKGSLLLNRRAQLLQALLIVTYLVAYTVALSAVAIGPTVVALLRYPESFAAAPQRAAAAATELFFFEERLWPLAVVLVLLFGLHSIYMSHRIYGPLVRVRAEADRVAEGDLSRRVVFRKGDQLSDLQDSMNDMIAATDTRVAAVQRTARSCAARLRRLHEAQFTGSPRSRLDAYEEMTAEFNTLLEHLAEFKTTDGMPQAGSEREVDIETAELPRATGTGGAAGF
jgi:methyl-accepting chemotaxis protein